MHGLKTQPVPGPFPSLKNAPENALEMLGVAYILIKLGIFSVSFNINVLTITVIIKILMNAM